MRMFIFNSNINKIELNIPEILLIREFSDLWNRDKNKDLAYRQLTYIWLMHDWGSPYSQYEVQERHRECLADAGLPQEEFDDEIFRECCRKYKDIQESSKVMRLIKAAQGMVDKLTMYFDGMDLEERDAATGKPIFKARDVMTEMQLVSKVVEELQTLEILYKKQQEAAPTLKGGAEEGFDPGEF